MPTPRHHVDLPGNVGYARMAAWCIVGSSRARAAAVSSNVAVTGVTRQTAFRRRSAVRNHMTKIASSNGANSGFDAPNVVESTPWPAGLSECHPAVPDDRIWNDLSERDNRGGLIVTLMSGETHLCKAEASAKAAAS